MSPGSPPRLLDDDLAPVSSRYLDPVAAAAAIQAVANQGKK